MAVNAGAGVSRCMAEVADVCCDESVFYTVHYPRQSVNKNEIIVLYRLQHCDVGTFMSNVIVNGKVCISREDWCASLFVRVYVCTCGKQTFRIILLGVLRLHHHQGAFQ